MVFEFSFFLEIIGYLFLALSIINITVVIGLLRSNNQYTLSHVATVHDSLGIFLSLFGLIFLFLSQQDYLIAVKVLCLVFVIFIFNPLASYVFPKIFFFEEKVHMEEKQ